MCSRICFLNNGILCLFISFIHWDMFGSNTLTLYLAKHRLATRYKIKLLAIFGIESVLGYLLGIGCSVLLLVILRVYTLTVVITGITLNVAAIQWIHRPEVAIVGVILAYGVQA